jgi:2-polyprenyl-6-methoxyphenol hydroxylase-like FAD-dependent oxidoreductase
LAVQRINALHRRKSRESASRIAGHHDMRTAEHHIAIIGGSLAGLTLALACAKFGIPVNLYERSLERTNGGDSLSVDLTALADATGHDPREGSKLPVVPAYRDRHLTTWPALYAWLSDKVSQTSSIMVERGKNLIAAQDLAHSVQLDFADGTRSHAKALIGADGYASSIRRVLTPETPYAKYAGYVVWRGLVEESRLQKPVALTSDQGLWIDFVKGYRLVAAVLPGRDGSLNLGHRQITFAWFEAGRQALLRQKNCLTVDEHVIGTLGRDKIDPEIRQDLASRIPNLWPEVWAEAVSHGVQSKAVLSGSPIAEYRPALLAKGRVAIIGDAAHTVSPMTGSGFASAVEDAAALARLLAAPSAGESIQDTLARYESARRPYSRRLVASSMRASAEFVRYAQSAV